MKKLLVLATAAITFAFAAPAHATVFTLDDYSITYNSADPGLRLYVTESLASPSTFALDTVGQSYSRQLFRIGTQEGSIESDDEVNKPISVSFSFSAPTSFGGSLGGTTDGFIRLLSSCGLIAGGCGRAEWSGGLSLGFGTNGLLGVNLEDVTFATPGSTGVDVRFTLLRNDTGQTTRPPTSSVPEPTSLMLLGGGLVVMASRMRRRTPKG